MRYRQVDCHVYSDGKLKEYLGEKDLDSARSPSTFLLGLEKNLVRLGGKPGGGSTKKNGFRVLSVARKGNISGGTKKIGFSRETSARTISRRGEGSILWRQQKKRDPLLGEAQHKGSGTLSPGEARSFQKF